MMACIRDDQTRLLQILCIIFFISVLNQPCYAQTTTVAPAPNTTTDNNTTIAPTNTTASSSTQAPTTTTTLPPTTVGPLQNPSRVPINTDIGACDCDLTANSCDINCCCDSECSAQDKQAFVCLPSSLTVDDRLCYREEVFLFENSQYKSNVTSENLFCIYFDNYKQRNYYQEPDLVRSITTFQDYTAKYAGPSFQTARSYTVDTYTFNSFYKFGDPIFIVYENNITQTLGVPTSTVSRFCNDQNPAAYLKDQNLECVRQITDLFTDCSTPALSAGNYYLGFRVVKTPGLFGRVVNGTFVDVTTTTTTTTTTTATTTSAPTPTPTPGNDTNTTSISTSTTSTSTTSTSTSTTSASTATATTTARPTTAPTTVNPSVIYTLYNNTYTTAIRLDPVQLCRLDDGSLTNCSIQNSASYSNTTGTCSNAVEEVRYTVLTNGTYGIESVTVQFVLTSITRIATKGLVQKTSISFRAASVQTNETFSRSGNPGYVAGKPIRAGIMVTNTSNAVTPNYIDLGTDNNRMLTIVKPSMNGECDNNSNQRVSVRFREDMRSGCLLRVNYTIVNSTAICNSIQQLIYDILDANQLLMYVPMFGNVDAFKVGDWVQIINNRPTQQTVGGTTCRLVMGMNIQVLYANVGSLANPQAKILGVAFIYDSSRDLTYTCVGVFCQSGNQGLTQSLEISQTVSFVDVSQPAIPYVGEPPIFIARVPIDFFYPFYTSASSSPVICAFSIKNLLMTTVMAIFAFTLS